jgi:hypothetical protein
MKTALEVEIDLLSDQLSPAQRISTSIAVRIPASRPNDLWS